MAIIPNKKDRGELLPIRNPHEDMFVCSLSDLMPKDDIHSMEHPIFSLSTKPDQRTLTYEYKNTKIEITPSMKGLATIHDKDILIYCISQLIARKDRNMQVGRKLYIQAYDLLVATNRPTGGESYERLIASLDRLSGTRIKTNIEAGGDSIFSGFGLIEGWDIVRRTKTGRMVSMTITLSEWLYNSVMAEEILTLNKDYFRLRKPIERRIYEIIRKHCGTQNKWKITLSVLHKKCGSADTLRKFRMKLRDLEKSNHMPDYNIHLDDDIVTATPKRKNIRQNPSILSPTPSMQAMDEVQKYAQILRMSVASLKSDWAEKWTTQQKNKGTAQDIDQNFIKYCAQQAYKTQQQKSLF